MRTALLLTSLCVSGPALGSPLVGRVMHDGQPVIGAQVKVYSGSLQPVAGCARGATWPLFGRCLCPAERDAFTTRILAGVDPVVPAGIGTTGPDGTFSIPVEGSPPFSARVISADGALGAWTELSARDVTLGPTESSRVRLGGITANAVAFLVADPTGDLVRMEAHGNERIGPPLTPDFSQLLVVAPGAVPLLVPFYGGRVFPGRNGAEGEISTVTLGAEGPLRGVVSDPGRSVAGVEVVADPDVCAVTGKTDAIGQFSLPSPTSRPWATVLVARTPGKVANGWGQLGDSSELHLTKAARLELTFVDAKGIPVAGVEPSLNGQPGANRRRPASDKQGRWTLNDLVDGRLELYLPLPFVLLSGSRIDVRGVTKVRVVIARGITLTGRVVDATGRPVSEARVEAFFGEKLRARATPAMKNALQMTAASSGGDGTFEVRGLLPGEYDVVATHPAFGEGKAPASAPGRVELTVECPYAVEGDVVDPSGRPIPRAFIHVRTQGGSFSGLGNLTDSQGHFRTALMEPGTFQVTASRSSRGTGAIELSAEVGAVLGKPLKFVLEEVGQVRGTVVDASGDPQANVRVQAVPADSPGLSMGNLYRYRAPISGPTLVARMKAAGEAYGETLSAADGSFTLPLDGAAMIFVESGGLTTDWISATPAAPVKVVVVKRAHATGRVVDWEDRPVDSFSINSEPHSSPDGRFDVPLRGNGSVAVRIVGPLAPTEIRTVLVPEAPVAVDLGDIKLKRGFLVFGRVLATATGKPISPTPYLEAKSAAGEVDPVAILEDGTFTLKRVPEGPLELRVRCAGYAAATATVGVKAELKEQVLKLEKSASLEITVVQFGEPVVGIGVELSGPPSPNYPTGERSSSTYPDGRVKFDELVPGRWKITLRREGAGPARSQKLAPGEDLKLELALP